MYLQVINGRTGYGDINCFKLMFRNLKSCLCFVIHIFFLNILSYTDILNLK